MAQKKRGLGRGLQALIPDTQAEDPTQRPSDVFFPRARGGSHSGEAEGESLTHALTSSLLEPRPRKQGSAKKRKPEAVGVSRETPAAAHDGGSGAKQSAVSRETLHDDERRANTDDVASGGRSGERGAGDALGEDNLVPVPGATYADIAVDVIVPNPRQPRQVFDDEEIEELAASIREVGLLQPVVVRRAPEESATGAAHQAETQSAGPRYELIMGERRLRASKLAGLTEIPAIVRYTEDEDLLRDALLENLHRVQLNPLEEAAAYQQLLEDFQCTHTELAGRIARSRSQISNSLRLMKLPPLVQRRVAAGVLSAGHARALLGLPDAAAMERVAQRIVAEGLSVRATEEIVSLYGDDDEPKRRAKSRSASRQLTGLASTLSDVFDTRVKVTQGATKGKITIEFAGDDDLARILATLAPGTSIESIA